MLSLQFHFQFIFHSVVLPQNFVEDVSVKQHDFHLFSIIYMKSSSFLLFCALRLKGGSGYVDYTAFRSSHNSCNTFGMNLYHIYDNTEMTASYVTHLQYENIHITFVNVINTRTVVIALPKSSLCTYTSPIMPRHDMLLHIITVPM
jgi:hypothetical protein